MSLLNQGEGRTSEDLEGDKPPPAPDQAVLVTDGIQMLS